MFFYNWPLLHHHNLQRNISFSLDNRWNDFNEIWYDRIFSIPLLFVLISVLITNNLYQYLSTSSKIYLNNRCILFYTIIFFFIFFEKNWFFNLKKKKKPWHYYYDFIKTKAYSIFVHNTTSLTSQTLKNRLPRFLVFNSTQGMY